MEFKTADKELIREINKSAILKIIKEKGPISRADIAKITNLNPATVTNNVNLLIESGIVIEKGTGESSGGRKPVLLEINKNAFYVIGADIGIDKAYAAIVNLNGEVFNKVYVSYENDKSQKKVLESIKKSIYKVINESKINKNYISGIGIGVHGIVNSKEGISVFAPGFGWNNVNIKKIIEDEFNLPVYIENDVRVMALGEKWFGAAKDVKNFVVINIGRGIGSAIVINGELYSGSCFGAGEIGHLSIVDNGPKCSCGNYGCLEVMASGTALEKRVISSIALGQESIITNLVNDDLSKITGKVIYEAAKLNDKLALSALYDTGIYIGYAVSNLINILNPEMIIIGGGVALSGDYLLKPIREIAFKKSMKHLSDKVKIVQSSLKDDCGIIGAAALIIKELFNKSSSFI